MIGMACILEIEKTANQKIVFIHLGIALRRCKSIVLK